MHHYVVSNSLVNVWSLSLVSLGKYLDLRKIKEVGSLGYYITGNFVINGHLVLLH